MKILGKVEFNKEPERFMHIDLNSCFATVEQQYNPLLRNKPIAVAAYATPGGILLAPSIEAKLLGIKLGITVRDARKICPKIVILKPSPDKYRVVHHKLKKLLLTYTDAVIPKSVDEFVIDFKGAPSYKKGLIAVGNEIKQRIKTDVGDYLTVSIGISNNRFLAKTASNIKKPDGLEEITPENFLKIYENLELISLTGIGPKMRNRLNACGIHTVLEMYGATSNQLKSIFKSVAGHYWYLRLRGYEIENYKSKRKSFSQQYALPKPLQTLEELRPIIIKLIEKMCARLRENGYKAGGVQLAIRYKNGTNWNERKKTQKALVDSKDFYKECVAMFYKSPQKPIRLISVGCFNLSQRDVVQLDLFDTAKKNIELTKALDELNKRWGKFTVTPGSMISKEKYVPDRIGFGSV